MRPPPGVDPQKSKELFAKLDVNGDGSIDASEMKSLTDYLGAKTGKSVDASAVMTAIDTDGNGSVSSAEFTDNTRKLFDSLRGQLMGAKVGASTQSSGSAVDKMFAALDSNGDGSISADEFKSGMQRGPTGPTGNHGHGHGHGRMIAQLLEMYGTDAKATTSSSSLVAAA
jgi:Ca2+-binding EF-hand superfamily protein